MNHRFTIVETSLNRAEFRWKWLRFLQHSFVLCGVLCLLVLLLGGAILVGWVTSKALATTFFALLAVAGFIAWAVILISVVAGTPDRTWLAAAVERVDRRLLDRLNTLLFLERHRRAARAKAFSLRIARQTQSVLAEKASPPAFPATRSLLAFLAFIVVLLVTLAVYQLDSPWARLVAAERAKAVEPARPEKPLELALPPTNNVEQNLAWGEVRITDPGADLTVTKVDVVPLQIEAAANQALTKVGWFSTINDAGETPHELPPPTEPRYAVYQPLLYLDELRLADWDVMTYYAKAETEKPDSFASEVYFLEVRPFREDILKMPGGEDGKAYKCLNELSMLIRRQQHVIRQTHQHAQKPPEQENLRTQDRKKLADAESDLSESAQHLYAMMASTMENLPIGEALDNLAKAKKSLARASTLLLTNILNDAQAREHSALTELIAARKSFQKAVSDHPDAFADKNDDEATPVADSSKKLSQIAEFRNEAKAAQQFVQKTLEQQRSLEQQTRANSRSEYPRLGSQERQLLQVLEEFQGQHPQVFKPTQDESQRAQQALSKAADSLQRRGPDARAATQEATQQLEQLSQAMQERSGQQQLADAYRLKRMLDQQIQTFDQCAQPGSTVSDADLQKTASEARETLNQLKRAAEQEPTRDAFGQPLRDALSGQNKVDLDSKLVQLQQAQDEAAKQQRSADARDGLAKVSKAFAQSEPKSFQMAQKTDSLQPDSLDSFNLGMAELESLLKQLEKERRISPEDLGKLGQQALFDLQTGLRSPSGGNDEGNRILLPLQQMLKDQKPLEVGDLKKLLDELQHFSVETSDRLARKDDKPDLTNIDPTRLPPAYRGRIQKYFEKLSEK